MKEESPPNVYYSLCVSAAKAVEERENNIAIDNNVVANFLIVPSLIINQLFDVKLYVHYICFCNIASIDQILIYASICCCTFNFSSSLHSWLPSRNSLLQIVCDIYQLFITFLKIESVDSSMKTLIKQQILIKL